MNKNTDNDLQQEFRAGLVGGFMDEMNRNKRLVFWYGVAMTAVGVLALLFPAVMTLTAELMVGLSFLAAGLVGLLGSFTIRGTGPFFAALLLSLLTLAVGVYMLANPAAGAIALTIVVAAVFMVQGAYELMLAFSLRGDGRGWLIASALIAILVGVLIAAGLPGTSVFTLGILVGINFLSTGVTFLMIHRQLKAQA